jgi:endonuclease/exonuclease/phosphatase (EEP) superfamily protein YafD
MSWRAAVRKAAGAGIIGAALFPPLTGGWLGFDTLYPFSAFLLHAAVGALLCALAAHLTGSKPLVMLALAASLFNIGTAVPLPPEPAAGSGGVVVMSANGHYANNTPELLEAAILDSGADIVALQEVTPRYTPMLEALKDRYPHKAVGGSFNIGTTVLLSRYPFDLRPALEGERSSFVQARVALPTGTVEVLAVHLIIPLYREEHFADAARLAARLASLPTDAPVIVAGDFNATPWMAALDRIRRAGRLQHAEGYRPSYPSILGWFGLPIDHVLVRGYEAVESRRISGFGSDHAALRVVLRPIVPWPPAGSGAMVRP